MSQTITNSLLVELKHPEKKVFFFVLDVSNIYRCVAEDIDHRIKNHAFWQDGSTYNLYELYVFNAEHGILPDNSYVSLSPYKAS